MFETVLAATDGSRHGTRATEVAASVAARFDARLVLLGVVVPGAVPAALRQVVRDRAHARQHPMLSKVPGWFDDAADSSHHAAGETHALIEHLASEALNYGAVVAEREGCSKVVQLLEHGDPAERILHCAEREGADLIVMGRRGLSFPSELLMGSVSNKVTRATSRCCMTVM